MGWRVGEWQAGCGAARTPAPAAGGRSRRSRGRNFMKNIIFLWILLVLISCNASGQTRTTSYTKIPTTDFIFRSVESFQVSETDDTLFLRKPADQKAPVIFIWGKSFSGINSRDVWLDEVNADEFYSNPQEIEVNNISGFFAKYEEDDYFSIRAVLFTQEEGMVLMATSHSDEASSTEVIFKTILNSVSLQKDRN